MIVCLMIHCSKEETRRELEPWVMESVAFARALPARKK
jgi:hypothetical protein